MSSGQKAQARLHDDSDQTLQSLMTPVMKVPTKAVPWKPSDPLPRLAIGVIVDAITVLNLESNGNAETLNRMRLRTQKAEVLLWLREDSDRPFSLAWCLQVLSLAGMEISRARIVKQCRYVYYHRKDNPGQKIPHIKTSRTFGMITTKGPGKKRRKRNEQGDLIGSSSAYA